MSSFQYVVLDKLGNERKGSISAISKEKARESLRVNGDIPISISEENFLTKDLSLAAGSKVKQRDLSVFCRQFSSLLRAGINLVYALDMLSSQTEHLALKKALREVKISVEKGETLTNSMQAHEGIFPKMLINLVEAGEKSGNLENSLNSMASHFEKDYKLKATIKKATTYPIFVMAVGVGVLILMLAYVLPQFTSMFDDMGIDLPFMTKLLMDLSDGFLEHWIFIVGGIVLLVGLLIYFKRTNQGKLFFSKVSLKTPLFGILIKKSASARFARTLSTLLGAGISIIEAMEIVAKITDNVIIKNVVLDTKKSVARGGLMSETLKKDSIFPTMVSQMVSVGEESGQIEEMLQQIADYYEEEVENETQKMLSILEPMLIIVVAGMVVVILMAIFSPMLAMYSGFDNL